MQRESEELSVSLVVPAYNAEKTLAACVGDLLAQSRRDFELILVDDGSTDGTARLCDGFARQDARVRVIHQANRGLSAARNAGVQAARGRYVTFVDSDDRVEPYYLEYLCRALADTGAACAVARVDRVREGAAPGLPKPPFAAERWGQERALSEILTSRRTTVSSWNKLAPRALYLRHPFWEGKLYEDLSHTYRLLLDCESVAFVDAVLYHYVMSAGSITGRACTTVCQCQDYEEAIALCTGGILARYPGLAADAAVLQARDTMSLYLTACRCGQQTEAVRAIRQRARAWFRQNWKRAFCNPRAPIEVRLRVLLMGLSPWLYQKLYYWGIRWKGKGLG